MNINKQNIFKQVTELVNQIVADIHPVSQIKSSDSIDEIFEDYVEECYAELILAVEEKFGVDIEAFMEDIKTIDDLCITIASLLSEKEKQPKKIIDNNPKNFAKQQILHEISKMIYDADLSTEKNPTFETPLEQDFQFVDMAVYDAIEKKYNITIENMDHVKTVGDLCNYIMKKRIAKFQQNKKVYNNPVVFTASRTLSPVWVGQQQTKTNFLQRIKQRFVELVR